MCRVVIIDDIEIETVGQLKAKIGTVYGMHDQLGDGECLCCVDVYRSLDESGFKIDLVAHEYGDIFASKK